LPLTRIEPLLLYLAVYPLSIPAAVFRLQHRHWFNELWKIAESALRK